MNKKNLLDTLKIMYQRRRDAKRAAQIAKEAVHNETVAVISGKNSYVATDENTIIENDTIVNNKSLSKQERTKRVLRVATALMVLGVGCAYMYIMNEEMSVSTKTQDVKLPQKIVTQKGSNVVADMQLKVEDFGLNPFISPDGLKQMAAALNPPNENPIHTVSNVPTVVNYPTSSVNSRLTSVPLVSRILPTLKPNAAAPTNPPTSLLPATAPTPTVVTLPEQANKEPPSVQGVLTGNDGKNIAIMSDGSVVSEGETFHDNRIAFIGGDGIKFADGSAIEYKDK